MPAEYNKLSILLKKLKYYIGNDTIMVGEWFVGGWWKGMPKYIHPRGPNM